MTVLLHYDRTDLFVDLVQSRFPAIQVRCCNTYADLPAALDSFSPKVLFLIKFEDQPYPRDAVMACRSLRWVSNGGVGIDHLMPWDPGRLTVTNAAGVASEVMAYYVLGGIIALTMRLPHFLRRQLEHDWEAGYVGCVAGRIVTVLGLGHTGRAVARLATATGLKVVGTRANPGPTEHVDRVYGPSELYEALGQGDYVVITVPLLEGTKHMIDVAAIEAMKPGAFLIDVSRGGVVDAAALLAGVQSGKLGGAMLDVFEHEPIPSDSPLWDMENVIITPHCSSVYEGWERKTAEMFCDNLDRWLAGEPLENVVDPVRGY
ncbi:MAG: D-2-hydroxyacid dehydrogenase [Acidiferrobacterales bacterium]